jgi:hypothetical protein
MCEIAYGTIAAIDRCQATGQPGNPPRVLFVVRGTDYFPSLINMEGE